MKNRLSDQLIIYQYKRIRHIHFKSIFLWTQLLIAVLYIFISTMMTGLEQIISILLSLAIVQFFYPVLLFAYIHMKDVSSREAWTFHYRWPWMGFIPKQYLSFRQFVWIHIHQFWVILALIGCMSPWASTMFVCNLIAVHVWMIAPKLILSYLLWGTDPNGLVKCNDNNISIYSS
jgi:hypothetical protein